MALPLLDSALFSDCEIYFYFMQLHDFRSNSYYVVNGFLCLPGIRDMES